MGVALTEMQANIQRIQESICLPPSRLAALASTSGRLEIIRCTVCHSLLLTAAYTDHLPSCRPCPPPVAPTNRLKSTSSHPSASGKAGSKSLAGKTGRGSTGGRKGAGRASKKPPAGPSRFAIEQGKAAQKQLVGIKAADELGPQMTPLQPQSPSAAPHTSMPSANFSEPNILPHVVATGLHQIGTQTEAGEGGPDTMPAPHRQKRFRTGWTYEAHLCRTNPELDSVHELSLPPRFPQSLTKKRTRSAVTLTHNA